MLEACAAGVPVVTSRRAGAAELLDGALAELVVDDPEDLVALRSALARALTTPRPDATPIEDVQDRAASRRDMMERQRQLRQRSRLR